MKKVAGAIVLLVGAATLTLWVSARRWNDATAALGARLTSNSGAAVGGVFRAAEVDSLPTPVARYLRAVLQEGRPLLREARLVQRGSILTRPASNDWQPFSARHTATVAPAGFLWDARINLMPGVAVRVRDAFVAGRGSMQASVAGVVRVVDVGGTADMNTAALLRYLAEAPWFPAALLPGQGVTWVAIDDSTARAILVAGETTAALEFHFGPDSLVRRVFAPARGRDVGGRMVPTPWQGHWRRYAWHDGMRIPVEGSVEWLPPEGPQPYWRGEVLAVEYRP